MSADFSAEILQAKKKWHDIIKMMKGENLKIRMLYLSRLSFRFKEKPNVLHTKAPPIQLFKNVKEIPLSEKERAQLETKIMKGKRPLAKANVVNQSLKMLVRRLTSLALLSSLWIAHPAVLR